ncbi:hypothetical protein GCM10007235_10830 [Pseudoxanthomonas indica]|nr:hypothetical protein GCM10007235_10830 [Pseudoxanthomonas indica]
MNAEIVARLQASFPASLASVMLQNRGEELIVAQRDIDAELVFLDTLLRTGAKAALVEETRSRIELLTERKTSIQAEIDLLNGRVRKIEEFVLHGPKKGKKRS